MPYPFSDLDPDDSILRPLLDALMESGQAISIYDAEDRLRYANKTYQDIFLKGYDGPFTFSEILRHGAKHGVGVRIDDGDVEVLIANTYLRRRKIAHKSFETDLIDGRWFWMDQTTLPNGWVLTVGADITDLKHNEKTLRQAHEAAVLASRTDPLTGLPNRRYILELLDETLTTSRLVKRDFCLALIDMDGFKAINDTYGHDAGDLVLQSFSKGCLDQLQHQRHLSRLGRMGGEEFLLLLPGSRLDDAVETIGQIRKNLSAIRLTEDQEEPAYTFSAGLTAALPQDDRGSILCRADRALYAAKEDGRDRVRIGLGDEIKTPAGHP